MASTKQSTSFDELTIPETGQQHAPDNRSSSLLKALAAGPSHPVPVDVDPTAIANTTPNWTTTSNAFTPMRMLRQTSSSAIADGAASGSQKILSGHEIIARQLANCSLNYAGDATRWRNQNVLIPDNKNTSIWITRLPKGVTYKELLGAVRNMGRVYSSHINQPEPHKGIYTAAAKLVFFEADAAQRFLARCHGPNGPGLVLRGYRATVCHNRNKKSEDQTNPFVDTLLVHPPALLQYFAARFHFNLDVIVPVVEGQAFSIFEWRFSSFSCQAEAAFMAMNRDRFFGDAGVTVAYGIDPCDRFGWA
jgi:hypothetical protein